MFFRKKKKAVTLIEVVISLSITAILIVPVMNMIVGATKNIQSTKNKEKAELIGKQVVEELKSIDLSNENEKTLTSGIKLTKDVVKEAGKDISVFEGEATLDNKFKVDVKLKEVVKVDYSDASSKIDGEIDIYLDKDNKVKMKKKDSISIEQELEFDGFDNNKLKDIKIVNEKDYIKIIDSLNREISIQKTNSNNISDPILEKTGYIKINLLNCDSIIDIPFKVDNQMTKDFNFLICTVNESEFKSNVTIDNNSKGPVIITENRLALEEIGDVYNLTVTIKKNGDSKPLVILDGYKNIYFN